MSNASQISLEETPRRRMRIPVLFWMVVASVLFSGVAIGLTLWIPRLQHQRTVDRIKRMGGVVYAEPTRATDLQSWLSGEDRQVLAIDLSGAELTDTDIEAINEFDNIRQLSIAGPKLTDSGLAKLKSLERLETLVLINCPLVTLQGEQALATELPDLRISRRGPALLGIVGRNQSSNCRIRSVRPGSAAAKAGLNRSDIITLFDGKPVNDFETLTRLIATKKPGDRVEVVAFRRGRRMEVTVELGTWKESIVRN